MYNTKDNETNSTEHIKAMRQRISGIEREGLYWSEEDRRQLEADYEDGVGISEIAAKLQRSETAVIQQLQQLHLVKKARRYRNEQTGCLCGQCPVKCEKYTKT